MSVLLDDCVLSNKVQVGQMVKEYKDDLVLPLNLTTNTEEQDLEDWGTGKGQKQV